MNYNFRELRVPACLHAKINWIESRWPFGEKCVRVSAQKKWDNKSEVGKKEEKIKLCEGKPVYLSVCAHSRVIGTWLELVYHAKEYIKVELWSSKSGLYNSREFLHK